MTKQTFQIQLFEINMLNYNFMKFVNTSKYCQKNYKNITWKINTSNIKQFSLHQPM